MRICSFWFSAFRRLRFGGDGFQFFHHIAELDPIRNEKQERQKHGERVGDGRCPRDTLRSHSAVHNEHQRNIEAALSDERQDRGLELFARCLEDGDDHHGDGDSGAGDRNDLQEILTVSDGFRVVNEESHERNGTEEEEERSRNGDGERIEEGRFDNVAHSFVIFRCEVVADQRQNALCHTVCDGKGENIDLFCNTHTRNRLIGVGYDHFIQYEIGERTHEKHNEAGNTDEKNFLRNAAGDGILFQGEIDDGDVFVFAEQADEIDDGNDVGEHGCDCRALYTEPERKDENGVKDDVHDTAERKTDACFLGVALRAHEVGETGIQNGGNTADGDRPEEIVGAVIIGVLVRSEKREERGT